jgi:hypothetical protein
MLHTARLTMVYLLVPILLLLCMPIPGSSSDAKGNYVAFGMGLESCQTFSKHGAIVSTSPTDTGSQAVSPP